MKDRLLAYAAITVVVFVVVLVIAVQRPGQTKYEVVEPIRLSDGRWFNPNDNQIYGSLSSDPVEAVVAVDKNSKVVAITKTKMYSFVDGVPTIMAVPADVGLAEFTNLEVTETDGGPYAITVAGQTEAGAFAQVPLDVDANDMFDAGNAVIVTEDRANPPAPNVVVDPNTNTVLVATPDGNVAELRPSNEALQPVAVFAASVQPALLVADASEVAALSSSLQPLSQQSSGVVANAYRDGTTSTFVWTGIVPALSQVEVYVYYAAQPITVASAALRPDQSWTIVNTNAVANRYTITGYAPLTGQYTHVQAVLKNNLAVPSWTTVPNAQLAPQTLVDAQEAYAQFIAVNGQPTSTQSRVANPNVIAACADPSQVCANQ